MRVGILCVLVALTWEMRALGQDASDAVFDDTALPTVSILFDPAHLDLILDPGNSQSDVEYPATMSWASPLIFESVDSVGFRLRGNTSRQSRKKSFKVSFNSFRQGGKWKGLEKLNLNGEHNDPSIMRSKLSWDLFQDFGVPASRANHVRLEINGEYFGLYTNVEHVDEVFLRRHFGRLPGGEDGNLYKSLWPADLTYLGPTGDAYRPGGDRRPYDLTQGASDAEGYDDLASFISVINNSSDASFAASLERAFDVNGFLRAQAVTTLTGSWDTYWFLKNNFYLYHNPATDRWYYLPFDFDNTFGIWWSGIWPSLNWATRDVYDWGHPQESRPLMERILEVPEFRERYTYHLRDLIETLFIPERLEADIDRLKAMTESAARVDGYRVQDYGFTFADYEASFDQALADLNPAQSHVTAGLKPFILDRYNSALLQLDPGGIAPLISDVTVSPAVPRPGDAIIVTARIDSRNLSVIEVEYWPDRPDRFVVPMTRVSGTDAWGVYTATIPALGATGTVDLRVRAVDGDGLERTGDLARIGVESSRPPVFINELMAVNEALVADEFGEYDDWVELFNGGSEMVDLAGWSLSDDPADSRRWVLPSLTLEPDEYLLLWTDGQEEQGDLHGPFRLAGGGETLALYDPAGMQVDLVSFGQQRADISWARRQDGTGYAASTLPTPGAANNFQTAIEPPVDALPLTAYPNPFRDVLTISAEGPVAVFDVLGRRVFSSAGGGRWEASTAAPGVYFVRSASETRPVVKTR